MKKVLLSALVAFLCISLRAQVIVTVGSALLQNPGTDVHLPVTVSGLNSATGGIGVTGIELHISYDSIVLEYDTTLNFNSLTPVSQWFYWGNGVEYASNWLEPMGNKLNIPDNTVLFDMVFHYHGGNTELKCDTLTCLVLDSVFNIVPGVQYINGIITAGLGADESRWNGTGSWNTQANWSNGIPGDSTSAIIETGSVSLTTNAACKKMTVNSGTTITIAPNYALTVHHNFVNNGTFICSSDPTGSGSMIVNGGVSGSGTNHINRYLLLNTENSHLLSSPVANANAGIFGSNSGEKYSESTASWVALAALESLQPGAGYKVSGSSPATLDFQGIFKTGNVTVNGLSYTAGQSKELRGLNLVGNPYPSALQLEQGAWQKTNLDKAVYVWDGYKYLSWNGAIGSLTDGIVPAMQGFFVKANAAGGSLTIPSASRIHDNQPFYKSSDAITNMIQLKVENIEDTNHFDETFIHILNGSTSGYDGNYDAFKLFGSDASPQIYSIASDQSSISINSQPEFTAVPVAFKPGVAGSYKIIFNNIESFDPNQALFFEDKTTPASFNIRNLSEYTFNSDGTLESGRFVLHFEPVGLQDHSGGSAMIIWNHNNTLHFQTSNTIDKMSRVDVYNLTGQCILSTGEINLPGAIDHQPFQPGLYIVKVQTSLGIITSKVIVK